MTKRDVERELDEISAELLAELTIDERVHLTVAAAAAGQPDRVERLHEACPTRTYDCTDLRYYYRVWQAHWWALEAMYRLEVAHLEFCWQLTGWTEARLTRLLEEAPHDPAATGRTAGDSSGADGDVNDGDDDEDDVDDVDDGAVDDTDAARQVASCFAACEVLRRAYERFATDVFGVDLASWLTLHPRGPRRATSGPALVETLEDQLQALPHIRARAETDLAAGRITAAGIEAASLDAAVDTLAEQLGATWAAARPRMRPPDLFGSD